MSEPAGRAGPERPSERGAGPERPSERGAGPERPSERGAGPERPSERGAGPERGSAVTGKPPGFRCPRHKVETALTCSSCGTPICPQCYVRTAVGLRCPKCAEGVTVKSGGGRRWAVIVPALAVLAVFGLLAVRAVSSGGNGDTDAGGIETEEPRDGATAGYRLLSRPDQGYSVEVPSDWQPAPDNSDTTASYAKARATEGSLRVSVNPSDLPVAQQVERLIGQLTVEGGENFVQTPMQIGGEPGIRLTYRFPTSAAPGATIASRFSYLVNHAGRIYSLQLSTTDPGANELLFAHVASSFKFL